MENLLKKYAELVVRKGINIQPGKLLVVNAPVSSSDFACAIAEEAYKAGAKDVILNYSDENFNKVKLENASDEVLGSFPDYEIKKYDYLVNEDASFISITSSNPNLLKDIDSAKTALFQKTRRKALKNYYDSCSANKNAWCVISVPSKGWAEKVFPDDTPEKAEEKLWDAIFKVMRITEDSPVKAWDEHLENLHKKLRFLNDENFACLHFTNSLGTDLKVELADEHIWCGGEDTKADGLKFIANMPTEEVFTTPKRDGVNGIVYSSRPLNYSGGLIENFSVRFENGKAVEVKAEKGEELLKEIINTDENSCMLGEVALVPYDSPISNSKIVFFNTLYDENASCHLAFGDSYPSCVKNGEEMTETELHEHGCNTSIAHVDFMIGTSDTKITGIKKDGSKKIVFENGNWLN